MDTSPRERLIETALALFDRHGYHATGIDRILREAGVAKMTLYNHFASKEALILEALKRRDAAIRERLTERAASLADRPAARLLAFFDALGEWFRSPDFHGCMFIAAGAEFGAESRPIRDAASRHKRMIARELGRWASEAGAAEPGRLGRQLAMLADGATVAARMDPGGPAAREARVAAATLVDAALGPARERLSG